MDFSGYQKALNVITSRSDIQQVRLIDGSLLSGKHVLMHAADEPALYYFSDVSIHAPLLSQNIPQQYSEADLILLSMKSGNLEPQDFKGKDYKAVLEGKGECYLYFPEVVENSSLIAFRELIAHLRAPEGCPWDRKQTHQTLKTNLLEETYEVLDAIDGGDPAELQEELGDLMLQIVLHAQISCESGEFDISDVLNSIHKKLTFRHPHVFKDLSVEDEDEVLQNWERLKAEERENNHNAKESILDSIPRDLPSLSLAQKYQERAARVGFDWPRVEPVLDKVLEEIAELKEAEGEEEKESELGDLLFALVNVVRWYGFDAESVLRKMTVRFYTRFKSIERKATAQGRKVTDLSLDEMDDLWELAKQNESKKG
jgi:tetrapyrrole methylase family protein/MazG family protein